MEMVLLANICGNPWARQNAWLNAVACACNGAGAGGGVSTININNTSVWKRERERELISISTQNRYVLWKLGIIYGLFLPMESHLLLLLLWLLDIRLVVREQRQQQQRRRCCRCCRWVDNDDLDLVKKQNIRMSTSDSNNRIEYGIECVMEWSTNALHETKNSITTKWKDDGKCVDQTDIKMCRMHIYTETDWTFEEDLRN